MSRLTHGEVEDRFKAHRLNEEGRNLVSGFRDEFLSLAEVVNERIPDGREKSLALTKLEEAQFYVTASIARESGYQQPDK